MGNWKGPSLGPGGEPERTHPHRRARKSEDRAEPDHQHLIAKVQAVRFDQAAAASSVNP